MYLNKYVPVAHWKMLPHKLHILKMAVADSSETFFSYLPGYTVLDNFNT
jgi:hypothetical protein